MKKFLLLLFLLSSCSSIPDIKLFGTPDVSKRAETLKNLNQGVFTEKIYTTPYFEIYSLNKIKSLSGKVIVYIEGDGASWIDRFTISSDPTPVNPLAFQLSQIDTNENIIYLSRPCQYISTINCDNDEIWTFSQYSEPVLSSYKFIIDNLIEFNEIHIVGYSGGAGIAMYLASINHPKIKSIKTVAGNINHNRLTQLTNISSLDKSVNFFEIENRAKNVPQVHYFGSEDVTVPKALFLNYKNNNKNINNKCIKIQEVSATHSIGWFEFWKNENTKIPNCN